MTIKKLISELEKFDDKFMEVEVCFVSSSYSILEIDNIRKVDKKVLIFTKPKN